MNFLRRYHISHVFITMILTVVVVAFTALEVAPYVANRFSRLHEGEAESSLDYGKRLQTASRIFPLDSMIWSKIGDHYSACIKEPLQIYQYADRIEPAYQKAIFYNPYRPTLYEQLYFLYRDINRSVDALQIMKSGVEANPNHLVLRLLLVRELEKIGSLALATYHVKAALFRIAPDKTELYLRLAELYELQGIPEEAKLYYQYARQVVPDSTQTRTRLQRLQQRLSLPPLND
jgi:tetratricopeptide (TPR) repeat protein